MSVITTKPCIRTPVIVTIWPVPGISDWIIESSVRTVIYQAESYGWSNKEPMEWTIYIVSVKDIDKTGMVLVNSKVIVEYTHATNSPYPTIAIPDIYITNL